MSLYDTSWVMFQLNGHLLGIDADAVSEMTILPAITGLPGAPATIRGVVKLRDEVFTVVDLRQSLGMPRLLDTRRGLVDLLGQREQDHRRWVAELESAVREGREFTLTRDPHACAFGRWYDHFETPNRLLAGHLKQFDAPHKAIHALADEVCGLGHAGRQDAALEVLERGKRDRLGRLIELFAEARRLVESDDREILVTLGNMTPRYGMTVDAIDRVARVEPGSIEPLPGDRAGAEGAMRLARVEGSRELVLLLDDSFLRDHLGSVHAVPQLAAAAA